MEGVVHWRTVWTTTFGTQISRTDRGIQIDPSPFFQDRGQGLMQIEMTLEQAKELAALLDQVAEWKPHL